MELTQEEVARRMGVAQSAYAKIEGGKTQPRLTTCKRRVKISRPMPPRQNPMTDK